MNTTLNKDTIFKYVLNMERIRASLSRKQNLTEEENNLFQVCDFMFNSFEELIKIYHDAASAYVNSTDNPVCNHAGQVSDSKETEVINEAIAMVAGLSVGGTSVVQQDVFSPDVDVSEDLEQEQMLEFSTLLEEMNADDMGGDF